MLKESNVSYSEIFPEPPLYFTNLFDNNKLEMINFNEFSTRKCIFSSKTKELCMPKNCECIIEEKIYWVSPKEILIEMELSFKDIPLSSNFHPRIIY